MGLKRYTKSSTYKKKAKDYGGRLYRKAKEYGPQAARVALPLAAGMIPGAGAFLAPVVSSATEAYAGNVEARRAEKEMRQEARAMGAFRSLNALRSRRRQAGGGQIEYNTRF